MFEPVDLSDVSKHIFYISQQFNMLFKSITLKRMLYCSLNIKFLAVINILVLLAIKNKTEYV